MLNSFVRKLSKYKGMSFEEKISLTRKNCILAYEIANNIKKRYKKSNF